jgi:PAS domain S-box-containing protein
MLNATFQNYPECEKQTHLLRNTAIGSAILTFSLGLAMMAVWLQGSAMADTAALGLFDMKFNTALALAVAGVGLFMATRRRRLVTYAASTFLILIGCSTLMEYLAGIDLGFDQLLLRDTYFPDSAFPGRMSPGTAMAMAACGLHLFLAADEKQSHPMRFASMEMLGFLVFGLGTEGLFGHIPGIDYAYGWGTETRMAALTAAGFMVTGSGLLALSWNRQDARIASVPLWLPGLLCLLVLLLDLATPRGVAMGIAYIPLIFCSLWFVRPHTAFVFAAVATVLTAVAFLAKTGDEAEIWIVFLNRLLTIGTLWLMAALVYMRRRTEMALRQSENKLSAVVDHALDGLIAINEQGIIEHFNPACERIFGYKVNDVIGRNIKILMPSPYHSGHDDYLAKYLTTGDARHIDTSGREVTAKHSDGSTFPIEMSISAFCLEDGRHFSGIIRDITERKQAEAYRQGLLDRLVKSNTELERFAYVASHDMQEPLRMITNFSQLITQDYADRLDDTGREYFKFIEDAGERLRNMVDDLLEYARLGNENMALSPVDGTRELEHVLENLSTLIEERKAVVTHDPLPQFHGNPVRFMRLLQNLIANAIKYQAPGNVPKVHIGAVDQGLHWCISVQDNGIGIDADFVDQVFQPFRRLHRWDEIKGTGIGLAICKKIVESHQGAIWATSQYGKGSVFSFTIAKNLADVQEAA